MDSPQENRALTRRDLLRGALAALGAAALPSCRPLPSNRETDTTRYRPASARKAKPERVAAQLAAEAPYVSKVVAYSYANLTPDFAATLPGL
jgi:hypothetical protein